MGTPYFPKLPSGNVNVEGVIFRKEMRQTTELDNNEIYFWVEWWGVHIVQHIDCLSQHLTLTVCHTASMVSIRAIYLGQTV